MNKRGVSLLLVFSLLFGLFSSLSVTVFAEEISAEEQAVLERIEYIQQHYAPVGSYFTDDGLECSSHSGCSYYYDSVCNCKIFNASIQCCAFAKYVFYNIFGRQFYYESGGGAALVDEVYGASADEVYDLFQKARAGDYIQTPSHYMIFVSADQDGLTVYEGNYGGRCRVNLRTVTYEKFASQYSSHIAVYTATPYEVAELTAPTVRANSATAVTETSATISGNVVNPDGYSVLREGYMLGTEPSELTKTVVKGNAYLSDKAVSYALTGLEPGTTYYYRIFCENGVDTQVSELRSFTTIGGVTVTFDAGSGSTLTTSLKGIAAGNPYGDLPVPARLGYIFTGWYTSETGGTRVTSDTTVPAGGSHRLYAHWTASDRSDLSAAMSESGMELTINGYGGHAEQVIIPAKLKGFPVTAIAAEVFSGHIELMEVQLPDTVTAIGDYAFADCALIEIELPASLEYLGSYVFSGCEALSAVIMEQSGETYSTKEGILYDRDKTRVVFCPPGKTGKAELPEGVTDIAADAFFGCVGITEVVLPNSLKTIRAHAFEGCAGLETVTLPRGLESIGDGAFMGCVALTEVHIPASVSEIGRLAFLYCTNLSGVTADEDGHYAAVDGVLTDPRTATLVLYPSAVDSTEYTVPDGIERIGEYAFVETALTTVTVPSSVLHIDDYAFSGCVEAFTLIGDVGSCVSAYAEQNELQFISRDGFSSGDVTGDGKINALDATRVLLTAVGKVTLSEQQQTAADVNGDEKVAANDATLILLHTVGKKPIV